MTYDQEVNLAERIADSLLIIADELAAIREIIQENRKAEIKTNAKVFMNKLYCECGTKMIKKELLVYKNPPLYEWECNECGCTYRSHKSEGF